MTDAEDPEEILVMGDIPESWKETGSALLRGRERSASYRRAIANGRSVIGTVALVVRNGRVVVGWHGLSEEELDFENADEEGETTFDTLPPRGRSLPRTAVHRYKFGPPSLPRLQLLRSFQASGNQGVASAPARCRVAIRSRTLLLELVRSAVHRPVERPRVAVEIVGGSIRATCAEAG